VTQYESGGPDHPEEIIELAKVAAAYQLHLAYRQRRV
jgi:hypothetical protein